MADRRFLGFESKDQPLLSRAAFFARFAGSFGAASLLVIVSLAAGMYGYHSLENMEWIDAFVNAAMILSGMGPMGELKTWGGKFFAGCYALYSGLTLVAATSIILAPVVHRVLHRFHVEDAND